MKRTLLPLYVLLVGMIALLLAWPLFGPQQSAALSPPAQSASPSAVSLPLILRDEPPTPTRTATATSTTQPGTPTVTSTTQPGTPTATFPARTPGITERSVGVLGFSDVQTHQVVRTAGDRVYLFAPEIYKSYIRAIRATSTGTPAGFAEADTARRPTAQSTIWSVDAAIDANDVVHLLYIAQAGPIVYQTFDTRTDTWGAAQTIANSAWPNRNNDLRQGSGGVALALDSAGVAHVLYGKTSGSLRRVYYNHNQGGTFNHEALLDDQPQRDNSHPALAFGPDGALYATWLSDDGSKGALRVRAQHSGTWGTAAQIDGDVFRNQGYSIDQGPSLLVTGNGHVHVAYIGPYEPAAGSPTGTDYGRLHHKYSTDGGATWTADDPPLRYTHNPSLATDADGNLYLFAHREYWVSNRCAHMLANVKPAGGAWGTWKTFAAGCFDASVSVKWSQYNWRNPAVLDLIYWTEKGPQGESDLNQLQYAEVRGGPGTINGLP